MRRADEATRIPFQDVTRPDAIDLFAGAGGATLGLRSAGFDVRLAIELDQVAADTYRVNHPDVALRVADIRLLDPHAEMSAIGLRRGQLSLLKACPPCQKYSSLFREAQQKAELSARDELVTELIRWIRAFLPAAFAIENVPGLQHSPGFLKLKRVARRLGYGVAHVVANAADLGVPQTRRRLLVAGVIGKHSKTIKRVLSRPCASASQDASRVLATLPPVIALRAP
ncbi:DNA cytosine methyltransferase [Myxococcota bacterium]|nr:DNA cytosine methyltransferase [Myxococcota bacterium]